jgi:hypothetical protein
MVLGGCYSLFLYNRLAYGIPTSNLFYGKTLNKLDISYREVFILSSLALGNLSLGLFPFFYTEYINTCCAELIISCCRKISVYFLFLCRCFIISLYLVD